MVKNNNKKKINPWPIYVFIIAVVLAAVLSYFSAILLEGAGIIVAAIILLSIILIGVVFDMLGVAVTAAKVQPFHSMCSHKEVGAKEAVQLLNYSAEAGTIFNDIVGDVCGIISGVTANIIVVRLQTQYAINPFILSCLVTALVSGLTISGKSIGKGFAIDNCTKIIHLVGIVMNKLNINIKK